MIYVYAPVLVSRLCPAEISLTRLRISPPRGCRRYARQLRWIQHQTTIWGSEVRILSGAPIQSET